MVEGNCQNGFGALQLFLHPPQDLAIVPLNVHLHKVNFSCRQHMAHRIHRYGVDISGFGLPLWGMPSECFAACIKDDGLTFATGTLGARRWGVGVDVLLSAC
jgi:hypothetical protein